MSTIRFGAACDNCPYYSNDYDVGTVVWCDVCERDLCLTCRTETGHRIVLEADEDQAPLASCEAE